MESSASLNADAQRQFAQLLERHRKIVFKVASTYAWRSEDRADLAQEIATQLWRAFPRYDAQRPFSTWMYRIALNVAISSVRRDGWRRHAEPLDRGVHEAPVRVDLEGDERLAVLQRIIAELEPLTRALLLLYLEEHSYREIADILGISETNVATKISRLKQRIRSNIERPSRR